MEPVRNHKRIGMYQNTDFKTKVIKPGLRSVKLTAENILEISKLKPGDSVSLFENTYGKDNPKAPTHYLVLPNPKPEDVDLSF